MRAFQEVNDSSNFVISFTPDPAADLCVFGKGYALAASRLSEQLLAGPGYADYEAYPVVFLYRHSFELYLKGLLYKAAQLSGFKGLSVLESHQLNTHRLRLLTERLCPILCRIFPGDQALLGLVASVRDIAAEFERVDPGSDAYRYPIDTRGESSTERHQVISLHALHRTMSELLEGLEHVDLGMQIAVDEAQGIWELLQEAEDILSNPESQ